MMAYSRGMTESGAKVHLVTMYPYGAEPMGDFESERMRIFRVGKEVRPKNPIMRFFDFFRGFLFAMKTVRYQNRLSKYDGLIVSNDNLFVLGFSSAFFKILGISVFFMFDEYPIPIRKYLRDRISALKSFGYRIALLNVSGMISMTEKLADFYVRISKRNIDKLVLSTITDIDRFQIKDSKERENYICYMGNMELAKDDVLLIIEAFSILLNFHEEYTLRIYGKPSVADKEKILSKIRVLGLEGRVEIKFAEYREVPSILRAAKVLVSAQPDTTRALGGFPTKLGEYLASGTPTLTTDIGEIARYVNDGHHVYLAKPSQVEEYANKLLQIVENYDRALEVAENGRRLIFEKYSHVKAGKEILNFINQVNEKQQK
jgi:glycosyltransferase involved in cell wall biosynthesis